MSYKIESSFRAALHGEKKSIAHVFFLRRGLLPPAVRVVDTTGADDDDGGSASCCGSCSVGVTEAARCVPFISDILFSGVKVTHDVWVVILPEGQDPGSLWGDKKERAKTHTHTH